MNCAINFCRCAIFKRLTQFRLLRRECEEWTFVMQIFFVDIKHSHILLIVFCFYSHSTNQLRNLTVFAYYFSGYYSSLVGIFGVERLPLKKCESWPILCFFLTPPTSALNVHAIVNGFDEDVIPSFL